MSVLRWLSMLLAGKAVNGVWHIDPKEFGNDSNVYEDGSNPLSDILDKMPPWSSSKDPILIQLNAGVTRYRIFRAEDEAFLVGLGEDARLITASKKSENPWMVHFSNGQQIKHGEMTEASTQLPQPLISALQAIQAMLVRRLSVGEHASFTIESPDGPQKLTFLRKHADEIELAECEGPPFPVVRWTRSAPVTQSGATQAASRPLASSQSESESESNVWYRFDEVAQEWAELETGYVSFVESAEVGTLKHLNPQQMRAIGGTGPFQGSILIKKMHHDLAMIAFSDISPDGRPGKNKRLLQRISGNKTRLFLGEQTNDQFVMQGVTAQAVHAEKIAEDDACYVCLEPFDKDAVNDRGYVANCVQSNCDGHHKLHLPCMIRLINAMSEKGITRCQKCRQEMFQYPRWKIIENRINFDDLSLNQ